MIPSKSVRGRFMKFSFLNSLPKNIFNSGSQGKVILEDVGVAASI